MPLVALKLTAAMIERLNEYSEEWADGGEVTIGDAVGEKRLYFAFEAGGEIERRLMDEHGAVWSADGELLILGANRRSVTAR